MRNERKSVISSIHRENALIQNDDCFKVILRRLRLFMWGLIIIFVELINSERLQKLKVDDP